VQCLSCQAENPSANRFCDQCGEPLEARCPQCGAALRAGARFCGGCGHRLAPSAVSAEPSPYAKPSALLPAAPSARPIASYTPKHLADKVLKARSAIEGERRQVTVLFADIAGFTSLAERRDPEEVHQIVDRCFEAITAEVHRFEGTINQYTGDGVMALFGAPIAHEDSARRAAHAALGIQRAMRDLSREIEARQGPAIRMRIGLNTGPVVSGASAMTSGWTTRRWAIRRTSRPLDAGLADAIRVFVAVSLEGDLEWAAEVHDARTAPRARLEPTWSIYSDSHAVYRHIHGVP
jgi:Adenylate and Guanylate cyclase catalytic domain/Double zinc ribbon